MRAIPEEKLKEYIEEVGESGVVYAASLLNLLEEIDTLTVSKLRPMSDAIGYTEGDILVYTVYKDNPGFERYIFDVLVYEYIGFDGNELMTDEQQYLGWIPMPTYKTE